MSFKKSFVVHTFLHIDGNTKKPVKKITGLVRWSDVVRVKAFTVKGAYKKVYKVLHKKHPELVDCFRIWTI